MNRISTFGLLIFLSAITAKGQLTYPVVDTDVSDFYDNTSVIGEPAEGSAYFGQDAHYIINAPSYTDNNDGTITDNVTGLMWQKNMGDKISYAEALTKAKALSLAGYNDWRIPTIKELYSLSVFTGSLMGENADQFFIDTIYFDQPLGDVSKGEREIDAQTWSSTHYTHLTMNGDSTLFGFNFVDGRLKGYPKYDPKDKTTPKAMYFRMVRGNVNYGINDFTDNGDETVTDKATGLMWQKSDNGAGVDWENALDYCAKLSVAGYSDWRLPNAKELNSIVDYSRSPESTGTPAIDPVFSTTEIKDYNGAGGQYPYFWTSSPLMDGMNKYSSAVYFAFGKAEGLMNTNLLDVHGAGAQRSDPKSGSANDYPKSFGPQGDIQYVYNYCRCVRTGEASAHTKDFFPMVKTTVFPIPANAFLNVRAEVPVIAYAILDQSGNICKNEKKESRVFEIDLTSLPGGVYILRLEFPDQTVHHSLSVIR